MSILYRIRNWEQVYENSESRKRDTLRWVATPNEHQGAGWGRMVAHKRKIELFCAWNLIIQVASKCRERGILRHGVRIYTDEDLAFKTGFPISIFTLALSFFSDKNIGWLEKVEIFAENEDGAELSRTMPDIAEGSGKTVTELDRIGSDRIEKNKDIRKHAFSDSPFFDFEFLKQNLLEWSDAKCRHYWQSAKDGSEAKGYKYLNWLAAIRNWARMDEQRGKPFLESGSSISETAEAIRAKYGR
jgi:hypothetical protein